MQNHFQSYIQGLIRKDKAEYVWKEAMEFLKNSSINNMNINEQDLKNKGFTRFKIPQSS